MTKVSSISKKWIPIIDPLRGIAALCVVINHILLQNNVNSNTSQWFGAFGVGLFFIISGFCIHYPNEQKNDVNWHVFFKRRAFRLLPTHYFALLLSIIASFYLESQFISKPTTSNIIAHILFIHTFSKDWFYSINQVFWSIAYEVHFYLLYPILLFFFKKYGFRLTIFFLFSLSLLFYGFASLQQEPYRFVLQKFSILSYWQWALGAYVAHLFIKGKVFFKMNRFLFAIVLVLIDCIVYTLDFTFFKLHIRMYLSPIIYSFLIWILLESKVDNYILNFFSWVGNFSYSTYLVHIFPIIFMNSYIKFNNLIIDFTIQLLSAIFFSYLFYLLCERHFINSKKIIKN